MVAINITYELSKNSWEAAAEVGEIERDLNHEQEVEVLGGVFYPLVVET